jgi:monoamine oxidase
MSPSRSTSHRSGGGGGGGGGKSRKSRRSTGALKRHQTVEGVIVEQPFSLQTPGRNQQKVGEGVYISTVVSQNKRFYGVMVDQAALKEASSMWFQEQADSLELNRRMGKLRQLKRQKKAEEEEDSKPAAIKTPTKKHFLQVDDEEDDEDDDEDDELVPPNSDHRQKRQAEDRTDLMTQPKRPRLEAQAHRTESNGDGVKSNAIMEKDVASRDDRSIQKFKFIDADPTETQKTGSLGHRVLLATFCNADEASGHDRIQTVSIVDACDRGGDFCGDYYYQYEHPSKTLVAGETKAIDKNGLRMSMGYHTFLQNTILPDWFPLANSTADSQRVLEMLNMKRDHHGNIIWDTEAAVSASDLALLSGGTEIPMQPRPKPRFQIGVIGGGVAGLACCRELIKQLDLEGIDGKVVLLEARDRLGGRLHTDYSTFDIPVDLGASWIHGIDHNPLAELAREANIDFVTAAEDVIMLDKGMQKVDTDVDTRMGKLFDDLLDLAANDCWGAEDIVKPEDKSELQAAVRWHSSVFANTSNQDENFEPKAVGVPAHRKSSDRSIDYEVGKAIAKHKLQDFAKLSKEEHRMLLWNTKNVEYALGANISDLSMKYWDADERHAFEGDHVLLKQGYSAVIEYMFQALQSKGEDRFQCITNFPVGKVEYARKSSKHAHDRSSLRNGRKLIDLSDTCSVSSQDGSKTHYFDFLVCAVPLGVLKESILASGTPREDVLKFYPSLPFSKKDSISNVGFGLLDKVFLQFRDPFWRSSSVFEDEDQSAFGNASELNPHHYMFFDVGKTLGTPGNEPAILMSLISGREAVACESLSDDDLVAEIFATLSLLFSPLKLPKPVAVKITRWGKDRFAR